MAVTDASNRIVQKLWSYCNVLRDESLEDSARLPDPHILAEEIAEDLRDALGQMEGALADLRARVR